MIIKKDTILIIETGAYSDHMADKPVTVLKDFDQLEVSKEYIHNWKANKEEWHWRPQATDFLAFLVRAGYVEALDGVFNWHVGDYEFAPLIHDASLPPPSWGPDGFQYIKAVNLVEQELGDIY